MALYTRWPTPRSLFGDLAVLGFLLVQCLDGALTYIGVSNWGLAIEANPVVSATLATVGLGPGVMGTKLFAAGLGIVLHLQRAHYVVALLTGVYVVGALFPWTVIFLAAR